MSNQSFAEKLAEDQKKIQQALAELEEVEMRLHIAFEKFLKQLGQARTERCQVCDKTYPPSEIVKRGHEQLCQSCDLDKYPLRDEDIPF